MSHVATIDIQIKDLAALKAACARLGLAFREGQKTYKWYGRNMGDYPLPKGFTKEDLGKCDHAIAVPGSGKAYEVGVVKRRDGRPGYMLVWDFWKGGYGLEAKVGKDCSALKRTYAIVAAKRSAQRQGFTVTEALQPNGTCVLNCTR